MGESEKARADSNMRRSARKPEDGAHLTPTAILVDGSFFLKRYAKLYGPDRLYGRTANPGRVASDLYTMCIEHLDAKSDLFRIFFYDCPPVDKKSANPVSKKPIDFSKTDVFRFRHELRRELVRLRKVAIRMGRIGVGGWALTESATKRLLQGKVVVGDLLEDDVRLDIRQKGVDMRIGLDIASLCQRGFVRRIVLVAGDADFVPAAKHARREGIDFILDPMWMPNVGEDLLEHVDGMMSTIRRPAERKAR